MKLKSSLIKISLLSSLLVVGCATPKVAYVDPNATNTLTTNFTQNDLRLTAQEMTNKLIQSGKMKGCKSFTISPVKNATDQYVDTSVMSNAMADTLTNSSSVDSIYVVSGRIDGKLTSDTSVGTDGKTKLVAYTFFVQMFDVQQGAAVWRNSKNISKGLSY